MKENSILLVIDVQDRLISTIYKADELLVNIGALINSAKILDIPTIATEQEKLGETVLQLKEILEKSNSYNPIRKLSFSCFGEGNFRKKLSGMNRTNLLICGIEAHICVSQTALDLMKNSYDVCIPRDATSSHTKEDLEVAIGRLGDAGATITTTEALIYELTERAGTPEFKEILGVVKDRRDGLGD